MQVRDGPAAVRGDARRGNATGREAGKAAEGEPRVRRPAALPDSNPSRKEDSCFADPRSLVRSCGAGAGCARRQRQDPRRRQDDDDLRRRAAARDRRQRPPGARRRQPAGEFYYGMTTSSFGDYVSQIGRYPAAGSTGWVFKVNGVSPPVGADKVALKDGDLVLWYWATFGPAGGPPTLELQRLPGTATSSSRSPTPASARGRAATLLADGKRFRTRGRACIGRHAGLVRATLPAPSARTPCSDPARARRARRPRPPRRLRWRRRGGGTATLWVTRDRGAELLLEAEVDAGQTLMHALDPRSTSRRATADASSSRSTGSRAASRASATGSGS